jgi:hypothetical protein
MKHSRWAAWRCDDQFVFYKIRDSMLQAGVVRSLKSGNKETLLKETGYLTLRVLSSGEFAMARTWMRGHKTGNEIALHMATFNGDKVNGLREEQLWFVDPPSFFTGDFVELSASAMSKAGSFEEESQLLLLLLRCGAFLNRTVILPSFKCEFTPVFARGSWGWPFRTLWDKVRAVYDEFGMEGSFRNSSRWNTILGKSSCEYYYHYDYRALQDAGVRFRPNSFFESFDRLNVADATIASGKAPVPHVLTTFQEFLSHLNDKNPSSQARKNSANLLHPTATTASRLILDWDLLGDSDKLRRVIGVYSAKEIEGMLVATQMTFGI